MRTAVALGSNLGDRLDHLKRARDRIRLLPLVAEPLVSSGIYETEPVGCEAGAEKFLIFRLQVPGWRGAGRT